MQIMIRVTQGIVILVAFGLVARVTVYLWANDYVAPDVALRAEGVPPLYLKVYNDQEIISLTELHSYLDKRKLALHRLVDQDPNQMLEVSVSPRDYLPLAQYWQIKDSYRLDSDQLILVFFSNGQRQGAMLVDESLVDLDGSYEAFEAALRRVMPAPPPDTPVRWPSEARVEYLRGTMLATDALALDCDPAVMLVDPISDLLLPYRLRAIRVELIQMPHLLADSIRIREQGTQ